MLTAGLLVQCLLDGLLLCLCALGLLGRGRGKLDALLPLLLSGVCLVARGEFGQGMSELSFAMLPIDRPLPLLFFLLALLLVLSLWFRAGEGHIFFGAVAVFSLFLALRELCFTVFRLGALQETFWYVYVGRILSLLLLCGLWALGWVKWLRERLADGDAPVRVVVCDTAALLSLALYAFQNSRFSLEQGTFVLLAALVVLVLVNGVILLSDHYRVAAERKNRLLEQYLPLVDELVEQVRARQHEHNNQLMAVTAALATAQTLPEAQDRVAELTNHAKLNAVDAALLNCDSKLVSGMLYGKVKQAELRHIQLRVSLDGRFLHNAVPEADWIELAGILIDNALEASAAGDKVYVKSALEPDGFRFTVSNPHPPLSNVEFVQMFRRGWSTKPGTGHGYGLYNVRQLVEKRGGRLVTRNDTLDALAYVNIGIEL